MFAHHGIERKGVESASQLILSMACELYPLGFRFRRKGRSGRGRKATRTIADKVDLWVLMQGLMDTGQKAASAAAEIRDKFPSIARGCSADTIETRFYEAERTVQRIERGEITDFEKMELLMRRYGVRSKP